VYKKLNSTGTLIQRTTTEAPRGHMYYIGLDVHKKTISYCVKDVGGRVHQEGKLGATRCELDSFAVAEFGFQRSGDPIMIDTSNKEIQSHCVGRGGEDSTTHRPS